MKIHKLSNGYDGLLWFLVPVLCGRKPDDQKRVTYDDNLVTCKRCLKILGKK